MEAQLGAHLQTAADQSHKVNLHARKNTRLLLAINDGLRRHLLEGVQLYTLINNKDREMYLWMQGWDIAKTIK